MAPEATFFGSKGQDGRAYKLVEGKGNKTFHKESCKIVIYMQFFKILINFDF